MANKTVGMRARILAVPVNTKMRVFYSVSRDDNKLRLRCGYEIGSSDVSLQTLGMRARIILGDSVGLPCWFEVRQASSQGAIKTFDFGASQRTERILGMRVRIIA